MSIDLHGYKRILIFGGSFDPPHVAHIQLPQQVAQAIDADLIAYVPAGRAPHKLDKVQSPAEHRLAMLRLALEAKPGPTPAVVLTDEIDRGESEPSYTVDTLERLRARVGPDAELRLLIGADQLRIFDTWRGPERIIALAEPVVMVRPPDTRASLLDALPDDQRDPWRDRLVDVDAIDLSSTTIRDALKHGEHADHLLSPAVAAYIEQHDLYRNG